MTRTFKIMLSLSYNSVFSSGKIHRKAGFQNIGPNINLQGV